jgi:predicted RND superfamily exporter protein
MAVAIMGGLIVATALTLLFLPALYAAWFRVKKPKSQKAAYEIAAECWRHIKITTFRRKTR